jgi:fumarylacetoacetase
MPDGYGPDHLPYGIFRWEGERPRMGARLGDRVIDLAALAPGGVPEDVFVQPNLNAFLALGREAWSAVRRDLQAACAAGGMYTVPVDEVELLCPLDPPDYVDFYSSIEHATNLGRMFRPDGDPLLPNWRRLPVGYHGRSASVIASGAPVRRPLGQRPPAPGADEPTFGPSVRLDFELELGFVTGNGPPLGTPLPIADWREHVFGVCIVNDWSARDLQRWEYVPLGPFLAKSFATSVSHWITPLEALEPQLVAPPAQDPAPFEYLRLDEPAGLDVELEVTLAPEGWPETMIARTNARTLYWTMPQQLAHAAVNGARVRAGDLYATGTISGSEPGTYGSLIELTWGGRDKLALDGGAERTFLEDGDTVVMRGRAGGVTLGEVRGTILPAPAP